MLETIFYRHKALIICGLIGFLFGPIGLIIGLLIGYSIDRGRPMAGSGKQNRIFFDACFLFLGHIAKLDGQVSEKEIQYTRHVMRQLHLSPKKTEEAMQRFYQGKNGEFDQQTVLLKLRENFSNRPRMLAQFLNILVRLAYSNGAISPNLKPALQDIATRVGLGQLNFNYYDIMFGWQTHFENARRGYSQQGGQQQHSYQSFGGQTGYTRSLADAYRILGVSNTASHADIKRAYRKLMSQYHPDKLMSKGLSDTEMQKATEKAQQIKSAYEQVCRARGFKH